MDTVDVSLQEPSTKHLYDACLNFIYTYKNIPSAMTKTHPSALTVQLQRSTSTTNLWIGISVLTLVILVLVGIITSVLIQKH